LEVINGRVLDPEVVAEEIDQLRATVAPDLFLGFRASAMPSTTLLAMDLTAAGYAQGRDAGEALALGLRVALFERGQDVSDPGVLQALADEAGVQGWEPPAPGVESESVAADHADGTERGVIGSPHFFTSAGSHFCPSLDVSRDESGALVVRTDPEGFEQLLAGVFGD
jgi:2-hydroxychromene-2-carboxylate isomerase